MKYLLLPLLFFSIWITGIAQNHIRIFSIKDNDKTVLYIENKENCPISLVLTLTLHNLVSSEGLEKVYVVPQNALQFKLTELRLIKRGASGYTYHYKSYFGDVNQTTSNDDYVYDLPFKNGLQFNINQGYNGSFSHQNENALDFDMPIGTDILAARDGKVVSIVDSYIGACLNEACKTMANYVLIYHSDGTFGNYAHIQYHGATVKVGDMVRKGDVIASSGNTGYTQGPHLHFVCFLPRIGGRETLATKFRIGNGRKVVYLQEGDTYKRHYD